MLETSPFAVIPSTKLPSSSILSPPSSSLSSSSPSPQLSLNPPSSSSSSVSFYFSLTSEVRVSPSYLNSSVFFLTTCFLLFIGFRCNILLTNISIDLLVLACDSELLAKIFIDLKVANYFCKNISNLDAYLEAKYMSGKRMKIARYINI